MQAKHELASAQTREPSHKTCLCFQLFRESPLKMRSFERLSAERETTFYEQLEREMFFKLRVPGINVSTLFCFLRWFRINNAVFVSKTVTSKVRSEPSSRKKNRVSNSINVQSTKTKDFRIYLLRFPCHFHPFVYASSVCQTLWCRNRHECTKKAAEFREISLTARNWADEILERVFCFCKLIRQNPVLHETGAMKVVSADTVEIA